MSMLTFYRQARADGGLRTGVDLDGLTLFETFEPGVEEHDPSLLWYVDLRCEGDVLPTEPEKAQEWLLDIGGVIRNGLAACADELAVGLDPSGADLLPYERSLPRPPDGSRLRIFVSAIRRHEARQIAGELRKLSRDWDRVLRELRPLVSV
jgi:hypothetical protein